MNKIKVLIIDDSAVVRQLLKKILSTDKDIDVVGVASDPFVARDKIKKLKPDVLTLDVEMPKMDGISFLRNLMRLHPLPVIMISSLTEDGADVALEALGVGAIDYISKPKEDIADNLEEYSSEIISKVKAAAATKFFTATATCEKNKSPPIKSDNKSNDLSLVANNKNPDELIITIGASTGGTEAIKEILIAAHKNSPAMVISQHIPVAFSAAFARRMNSVSKMSVCEATDGQKILPGHAYIAPGDQHLMLKRSGNHYYCSLDDGEPVNRHKPSVEVMFNSVAEVVGENSIGVLLTGMGADGALGLKNLRDTGAKTIAQDENSSVVWGMPGEAVKMDAADVVLSLDNIATKLASLTKNSP